MTMKNALNRKIHRWMMKIVEDDQPELLKMDEDTVDVEYAVSTAYSADD